MEMQLVYLIAAGWALMLFLGSFVPAVILAAAMAGAGGYLVFLDRGDEGDLIEILQFVSPVLFGLIFVAWPFGAMMRRLVRRLVRTRRVR